MAFRGTYDHSLDAKNRLTIPSKFRAVLSDGIVLAKPADGTRCVQIWPTADFDGMTSSVLAGRDRLNPDVQRLERFYNQNSWDTELDAAGRVNLPKELITHASLGKDVRIAGGPGCLEVWDREAATSYSESLVDDISDIAARLAQPS